MAQSSKMESIASIESNILGIGRGPGPKPIIGLSWMEVIFYRTGYGANVGAASWAVLDVAGIERPFRSSKRSTSRTK